MRRPRQRRRHTVTDANRWIGLILMAGGLIIILKLLPSWLLWGLAGLALLASGVFLAFGR
ncbi:MAG: hypothetical protein ACOX18_01125 [Bacillota bacterium]|jgi:hypothetical protein